MVNTVLLSTMAWASSLRSSLVQLAREERGQDLIEYAVLAGAIAFAGAVALLAISPDIFTEFATRIEDCVTLADECDVG